MNFARPTNELNAQRGKNEALVKKLEAINLVYPSELYHEIRELEIYSDDHIKPSQFERLRDNYRRAIYVIRTLVKRESDRRSTGTK